MVSRHMICCWLQQRIVCSGCFCGFVAQPLCMVQSAISGQIKVKPGEDLNRLENVYGVLRVQSLLHYRSQEDLESEDKPLLVITIRKCLRERSGPFPEYILCISTHCQ